MGKVSRLVRARADYVGFLLSREWPVVLSGAGVLLGAVTILPSAVGVALSMIALVLGSVTFARDFRLLRRRWASYEFSLIAAPFPTEDVPPPSTYPNASYLHVPNRGTALVSDGIDRELAARPLPVEVDERPYRLPRQLRASAPHVLPVRNRGRLVFNGRVVGPARGPPPPRARPRRPAPAAPGALLRRPVLERDVLAAHHAAGHRRGVRSAPPPASRTRADGCGRWRRASWPTSWASRRSP
nr:hypothetical protein GCM10020241_57650 [Streptoalloteichus tenebrarius]